MTWNTGQPRHKHTRQTGYQRIHFLWDDIGELIRAMGQVPDVTE